MSAADSNPDAGGDGSVRKILIFLFFLSGAAALIYELAWTRMLAVTAGGSTRALSAVVASYMGGLALGSWLGGIYADRRSRRPVMACGLIEGLVGLSAAGITLALPLLTPVLRAGWSTFGPGQTFEFFRFFACALFLFLPTSFMGATFPVLLRGTAGEGGRYGLRAGELYAANTLGAMAGSLLSGFALIPA